ncbi:MAG: serine protease, partial [Lachnospiraceae bacterium]|nr:serine protease [Lachnospiraceae bacterium]MBQ7145946.1 serine protease [Lachnospiraceae bacterium]
CAAVMSAWFNSASHKANMLGKNYTKVGVAGYEVNGTIYWVMVFSS